MADLAFEWDDAKANANLRKHGVSFEAARLVFQDVFSVDEQDSREGYDEDRFVVVGMANSRLLAVVYTERDAGIRIIGPQGKQTRRAWLLSEPDD